MDLPGVLEGGPRHRCPRYKRVDTAGQVGSGCDGCLGPDQPLSAGRGDSCAYRGGAVSVRRTWNPVSGLFPGGLDPTGPLSPTSQLGPATPTEFESAVALNTYARWNSQFDAATPRRCAQSVTRRTIRSAECSSGTWRSGAPAPAHGHSTSVNPVRQNREAAKALVAGHAVSDMPLVLLGEWVTQSLPRWSEWESRSRNIGSGPRARD